MLFPSTIRRELFPLWLSYQANADSPVLCLPDTLCVTSNKISSFPILDLLYFLPALQFSPLLILQLLIILYQASSRGKSISESIKCSIILFYFILEISIEEILEKKKKDVQLELKPKVNTTQNWCFNLGWALMARWVKDSKRYSLPACVQN